MYRQELIDRTLKAEPWQI